MNNLNQYPDNLTEVTTDPYARETQIGSLTQPEGVTNEVLLGALGDISVALGRVDERAAVSDDIHQRRLQLQIEGEALASEREADSYSSMSQVAALRLLAAAPHFAGVQEGLRNASGRERRRMVAEASFFNGLIRSYASNDPKADTGQLLECILSVGAAINPEGGARASEYTYWTTLWGAQHEVAATHILRSTGQEVQEASLRQDLCGIDVVVDGVPVDIKASTETVARKCGIDADEYPTWGVKNGVLVLWSHLTPEQLGTSFRVDPMLEEQICRERIVPILDGVATNPNIRMELV
ncbi:MAG TPA: hypothetical protein VF809_02845 [Candidatus Saccharimonadales bacterium]